MLRHPHRWALFAIREDYLGGLDRYLPLLPSRLDNTFRLIRSICNPRVVQSSSRRFTPARRLPRPRSCAWSTTYAPSSRAGRAMSLRSSEDYISSRYNSRLYAFACGKWWSERSPDGAQAASPPPVPITEEDVGALGNVTEALADYYTESIARVADTPASERNIREWFDRRLITPQGLRSQVLKGDEQGLDDSVIEHLVDSYLIRKDDRRGIVWFELAHDPLIFQPIRASNAQWFETTLELFQSRRPCGARKGNPSTCCSLARHCAKHKHGRSSFPSLSHR